VRLAGNGALGRTFFFDSLRHLFQGALDSAFLTIGLLVSIRVFHAPNSLKSILSALTWLGGLVAPLVTRLAARTEMRATFFGFLLFVAIAASFLGAAWVESFTSYLLLTSFASICFRAEGAVLIGMYVENYPLRERASRMALGMTLAALMGIVFGHGSGVVLDWDLNNYRLLLLSVAACALISGLCLLPIPSSPLGTSNRHGPSYLSYLLRDRLFGRLSLYAFSIGLAYQMLIPIKVEYLANGRYGLDLSNRMVMLLSWVIPNLARVLSTPFFGLLFDRVRLMYTRILVGAVTFFGILIFFNGNTIPVLALGSVALGMAMGGSYVLHSLWVAKITSEDRLPAYMSVYLLISGLRSLLAPLIGYALLSISSPSCVGNCASILVLIAIGGFWAERHNPRIQ
jgi:MFS family permease